MTRREWKPGDVAMVNDCTNPDAPWEPATCRESAVKGEHEAVWVLHKSGARVWGSVSQARPLVVIDPEDREAVERLIRVQDVAYEGEARENVTDAELRDMQAALREFANPAPPKPDEPTGWLAAVKDVDGNRWCLHGGPVEPGLEWYSPDLNCRRHYADINAVRVLSEGVTE